MYSPQLSCLICGCYVPVSHLWAFCRMLQSEVEALSCADEVVLDLERLLDLRLAQAVALRYCV